MSTLNESDMMDLFVFSTKVEDNDYLIAYIREYVNLMVEVCDARSKHGNVLRTMEEELREINLRSKATRPSKTNVPLAYVLMIQHLPVIKRYLGMC